MRFAISLVALLASASVASAETYHVAHDGNDADVGSQHLPWATLQHAAGRVQPGDTVIVGRGRYRGFYLDVSGTAEAPIRFVGQAGAVIHLDNAESSDGINLEGVSWVEIEGFEITGTSRAAIRAVECGAVTLRKNRIKNVGVWGIFSGFCDDLWVLDNEISGTTEQHCIYLSNSGDRPILRGNRTYECHQAGIQLNGDVNEGGDGVISGAVIEENIIHHTGAGGGAGINLDGVVGATIRNNLLYANRANGVSIFRIDGGAASTGNVLTHNTIVMPAQTRWAIHAWDGSTDTTIVNNILLSDHASRGAIDLSRDSMAGLRSDFNVVIDRFTLDDAEPVIDLAAWRTATGQDANTVIASAADVFADPANADYRLAPGSPARDAGDPSFEPVRDLLGYARPVGERVDIGAYEWCEGVDRCLPIANPADPERTGRHPGGRRGGGGGGRSPGTGPQQVVPQGCCGGGTAPAQNAMVLGAIVVGLVGRRRRT